MALIRSLSMLKPIAICMITAVLVIEYHLNVLKHEESSTTVKIGAIDVSIL